MRRCAHSLLAVSLRNDFPVAPTHVDVTARGGEGIYRCRIALLHQRRRERGRRRRTSSHRSPPPLDVRPSSPSFAMRFDRFRRRAAPPPSPVPPTPLPTSRSASGFRESFHDVTHSSSLPPLKPVIMSRSAYMRTLQARMEQMERVPTRSFFHSYAGEFDVRFPRPQVRELACTVRRRKVT